MKKTIISLRDQKRRGEKITMLTAYDYPTALLMDEAGIDCILVGDSLGMAVLGYKNTLSVTMEDMIRHTQAVSRGAKQALVAADMPFLSYQASVYDAVMNAGRLVKEGRAEAVKLEVGSEFNRTQLCPQIEAITAAGIPVMAHLGLTPQSVNILGGWRVQGTELSSIDSTELGSAKQILEDAQAVERAGAFAVVLECIPAALGERIAKTLSIPVIGIGAGPGCDGQVLVVHDMLGIDSGVKPKFVRSFVPLGGLMKRAFRSYIGAVRNGTFPAEEHCYAGEKFREKESSPC